MIVREAQGRGDLLLQKAQARLEEIERDITELRLRRRGVEGSLESSIQALYHALEFIREQDQQPRGRRCTCTVRGSRTAPRGDPDGPRRFRDPARVASRSPAARRCHPRPPGGPAG